MNCTMCAPHADFIMTRSQIEREKAVGYLVRTLHAETAADTHFPRLSEGAIRALAVEIVQRHGIYDYEQNERDMFAELRKNRSRWEYYGLTGVLRGIYQQIIMKIKGMR